MWVLYGVLSLLKSRVAIDAVDRLVGIGGVLRRETLSSRRIQRCPQAPASAVSMSLRKSPCAAGTTRGGCCAAGRQRTPVPPPESPGNADRTKNASLIIKLMPTTEETQLRLAEIPNLTVSAHTPLARYTRFGIGGPADLFAETRDEQAFIAAVKAARESGTAVCVTGGGTNLIVSDQGFRGLVLRYSEDTLRADGARGSPRAQGRCFRTWWISPTLDGLRGLETLARAFQAGWARRSMATPAPTGIPFRSASHRSASSMARAIRAIDNAQCDFRYRESIFKRRKDWIIFRVEFTLDVALAAELQEISAGILKVRNEKFPPTMKCAGSIFKNFLLRDLPASVAAAVPASVVREGKIPAAWFLEQVGAQGHATGRHTRGCVPCQSDLQCGTGNGAGTLRIDRRAKTARARAVWHRSGRRGAIRGLAAQPGG